MSNFWDSSVWGPFNILALILCALLVASLIKKNAKVLNETLKPFTNIDFKPDEYNYFISLKFDWRIKKEEKINLN